MAVPDLVKIYRQAWEFERSKRQEAEAELALLTQENHELKRSLAAERDTTAFFKEKNRCPNCDS
jgi:hypothetical protein